MSEDGESGVERADDSQSSAEVPESGGSTWRTYAQAALPALLFLVLFGISLYVVEWLGRTGPLESYSMRVAASAAVVLRLLQMDAQAEGARVLIGQGTGVQVGWQCCGLSLAVPVAAFFLAFPAPALKRIVAALTAFTVVQAINVLRVAALVVISHRARDYLVLSHDTLWNAFVIAGVLLVWLFWSGRAEDEPSAEADVD